MVTKVAAAKKLGKNMKNTFSETKEIFVTVSVSFKYFNNRRYITAENKRRPHKSVN